MSISHNSKLITKKFILIVLDVSSV